MTSNRRIVLHIGSPKCGSTYLQRVMLQNQKHLLKHGIRYPHSGGEHPGNAAGIAGITDKQLSNWYKDDCHTVVLSHEDLLSLPPRGAVLSDLTAQQGVDVELVCFLRPFNEFIYGDYSQFMKQNFPARLQDRLPYGGQTFEEFTVSRVRNMHTAGGLKSWQKVIPHASLRLESHRNIRPTLQDMLDLPANLDWTVPPDQINRSLRVADCEALAAAMLDTSTPAKPLEAMFREAFHKVEQPDPGRTPERDRWIEALFLERNRLIFEHFGLDNRLDTSRPYR